MSVPSQAPGSFSTKPGFPNWALALIALCGMLATGGRFNVAWLAWVAPVPFLLIARRLSGKAPWFWLAALLGLSTTLQTLKIVTEPVSPIIAPLFAVPAAIGQVLVLAVTEWLRRRRGELSGILGFAALSSLTDLSSYAASDFGAWTTSSLTQVSSVHVMQLASVVGLWGIGFLMSWVSGLTASILAVGPRPHRAHFAALSALLITLFIWTDYRLEGTQSGTITVGAVTTELGLDTEGLPSTAMLKQNTETLFERTEQAIARGAQIVAWPEAATLVEPSEEGQLVLRGQDFAQKNHSDLVLAYGVLVSRTPLLIDNKLAYITSEGSTALTYRKHHPVPGEPSMRGTEPLGIVERPFGKVGVAICYDYDFPALAREHARLGANLVVVPASDWRGIDPVHTEMARARAIEGGFSLLRSVRWGTSAVFDAYGRTRGLLPGREAERVLVAQVPTGRIPTVYTYVGDWPALFVALLLLGLIVRAWGAQFNQNSEVPVRVDGVND